MINGNGGKCKLIVNKYVLFVIDLLGEYLVLMESGNMLIYSVGVINIQFLYDMDVVVMNCFMSNVEQGGNMFIIIVGNEQFEDLIFLW